MSVATVQNDFGECCSREWKEKGGEEGRREGREEIEKGTG